MSHDEMVKQIASVCDIYTDDLIASTGATQLILGIVKQRIAALEAENARLREAILAINVGGDDWCPWCAEHPSHGHAPDCQRQAALAQTAQTSEVKA